MEDFIRMQIYNLAAEYDTAIAKDFINYYNKRYETGFELYQIKGRAIIARDKEDSIRIECINVYPNNDKSVALTFERNTNPFPQHFSGDVIESASHVFQCDDIGANIARDECPHGILILNTNDLCFDGSVFRKIKDNAESNVFFRDEVRKYFKQVFLGYPKSYSTDFSNLDEEW